MSNFSININLSKLPGAKLLRIRKDQNSEPQECIVIPVSDAKLFKGKKGVYMDLIGIKLQNPQYQQTHFVKQNLDKETYDAMTEDQRKNTPIIGNIRPIGCEAMQAEGDAEVVGDYVPYEEITDPFNEADDIPF